VTDVESNQAYEIPRLDSNAIEQFPYTARPVAWHIGCGAIQHGRWESIRTMAFDDRRAARPQAPALTCALDGPQWVGLSKATLWVEESEETEHRQPRGMA